MLPQLVSTVATVSEEPADIGQATERSGDTDLIADLPLVTNKFNGRIRLSQPPLHHARRPDPP